MSPTPHIDVDVSKFIPYLRKHKFTRQELLHIRGNGAKVIINHQRQDVARDTRATKNSIKSHIIEATAERVVDEIGPETDYSIYLEYGTGEKAEAGKGKPGWPGMAPQPFVRPSVLGSNGKEVESALEAAFVLTIRSKG